MMMRATYKTAQVELVARWLFVLFSVWAGVNYYLQGNIIRVLSAILSVALFILFPLLGRLLRLRLPLSFKVIWLAFIFVSMYLGELHNFFYRFSWWDELIHSVSAMLLTYVGLLIIYILSRDPLVHQRLGPLLMFLAMIWFTMSFGAVWELFEFSVDSLLGLNLLKGCATIDMNGIYDYQRALINTMGNLFMDLCGAVLVALAAFLHFRGGARSFFGRPLERFIEDNPSLFKRHSS